MRAPGPGCFAGRGALGTHPRPVSAALSCAVVRVVLAPVPCPSALRGGSREAPQAGPPWGQADTEAAGPRARPRAWRPGPTRRSDRALRWRCRPQPRGNVEDARRSTSGRHSAQPVFLTWSPQGCVTVGDACIPFSYDTRSNLYHFKNGRVARRPLHIPERNLLPSVCTERSSSQPACAPDFSHLQRNEEF